MLFICATLLSSCRAASEAARPAWTQTRATQRFELTLQSAGVSEALSPPPKSASHIEDFACDLHFGLGTTTDSRAVITPSGRVSLVCKS